MPIRSRTTRFGALAKRALPVLGLISLAALTGCAGDGSDSSTNNNVVPPSTKFSVAVIGDMPYGGSQTDTAEFNANPAFISAINSDASVSMVLHAGDIHSGKQNCTQAYNQSILNQWSAFKVPMVYTPGDNEWADCHKKKEGGGAYNATTGTIDYVIDSTTGIWADYAGGDPVANLDLVRAIFFATPGKTPGVAMSVHTQAQEFDAAHPTDSNYVENVWFEKNGVLFATANIPGGSNNGTDPWYGVPAMSPAQAQEVSNRSGATLRWLDNAFAKATANGDKAMVLMLQADMWDLDGGAMTDLHLTEYKQYIDKIAAQAAAYGKPVLLINGDSHIYRSDNPLVKGAACAIEVPSTTGSKSAKTISCADSAVNGVLKGATVVDPYSIVQVKGNPAYVPAYNVSNFHRIVVHGNATVAGTDKEYVNLTIDTSVNAAASDNAFGPFSWKRVQP
ncbi:Calcineurin-like phosphoesterase [Andreprevotia lacus DSM 23236]|uniref:Calcineurin-like phosphoesterase n=1 Tax=Andreprevotia lacus DSM 23236 TaxID=1121001 RepID=A0A1W1XN11_9NEIS|nr:metallophosphoesterase [Andreprevotia lacus]SMC25379.1 Calcineurin-like phosphoesterase [Andreprevotia lacus DSM 23236]